jgi:hypothetical protein
MVLALIFGVGGTAEAWVTKPRSFTTVDQRSLADIEQTALQTPGLRDLHSDEWPLTDIEFRLWTVFCCGYVLSIRRTSGIWSWTVHELRDPEIGYEVIDEGDGPKAERLWEDVQRLGVMELTDAARQRESIMVGGMVRVIQLRIDGGYIAVSSPMDDHSPAATELPHDRIVDGIHDRVSDFIERHVDFPPYPEDEEG